MEDKKFCPDCGFEFKNGDGNADYCYENGVTYYTCPDCGWEGTDEFFYIMEETELEDNN